MQIHICTVTGNIIYEDIFSSSAYTVSATGMPKGVYVYEISAGLKRYTGKIIICTPSL